MQARDFHHYRTRLRRGSANNTQHSSTKRWPSKSSRTKLVTVSVASLNEIENTLADAAMTTSAIA
ncbi:hypothetical protein J6590_027577 [Homalodisca vitripennis]|nr:hypothetical protein J6590_027577 [Homalodisca vitripennis]